jgi:hypothetical protein
MSSRISLILITAFWLVMNFLLWRSEFGGGDYVGVRIPVDVVWGKILTAPDISQLEIFHHGKKAGDCRWTAKIGQELNPNRILTDGVPMDGPVQKPSGYNIEFGGNLVILKGPTRLGVTLEMSFATNRVLREFDARLQLTPDTWFVHSKASEKTLRVRMESEDENSERIYKFSDLQNPQFLIHEFQLPISLQLLDALGLSAPAQSAARPSFGLVWEARNDWITLGHTSVRAYRLQARLFDRYRIIVMVSQVGEILRVELPDDWVLVNDQFIL